MTEKKSKRKTSDMDVPKQKKSKSQMDIVFRETLCESFNPDKLAFILSNTEFQKELEEKTGKDQTSQFKQLKTYLEKSVQGKSMVTYFQNEGIGRRYAKGGLGMQSFSRSIRHTICDGKHQDIDMVNAHPVIIAFMAQEKKLHVPALQAYNKDRETLLQTLGVDREVGKETVYSIFYGGSKAYNELPSKPQWIQDLYAEMTVIREAFAQGPDYEKHRTDKLAKNETFNLEASYLCKLAGIIENDILMHCYDFVGKPKECVFVFDGFQLPSSSVVDFAKLSEYVSTKMKFDIAFISKPMNQGLNLPDCPRYVPRNKFCFDYEDTYIFQDLEEEFREKTFGSLEELDEHLAPKCSRVIVRCLKGEGFYIKKMEDYADISKSLKANNFTMKYKNEQDKIVKLTIQDYLKTQSACNELECVLDPDAGNPRKFNTWAGFQAKLTEATPPSLRLIKNYILEVICNNDANLCAWITSWIAGLVTNLKGINQSALVLHGKPGCGKNTLFEFLYFVLGKKNVYDTIGIESIMCEFNAHVADKRLIVVNEMSATKDHFHSNFDKLKSHITDSRITIQPKGIDRMQIENISNFAFLTNHKNSFVVEKGDRRYVFLTVNDSHIGDFKYWDHLRKECFNQQTADAFYTYLCNLTIDERCDLRQIPDTELKQEMIQLSKPNVWKFMDEFLESADRPTDRIGSTELWNRYILWCTNNGERNHATQTAFGTELSNDKSRVYADKTKRCYVFTNK